MPGQRRAARGKCHAARARQRLHGAARAARSAPRRRGSTRRRSPVPRARFLRLGPPVPPAARPSQTLAANGPPCIPASLRWACSLRCSFGSRTTRGRPPEQPRHQFPSHPEAAVISTLRPPCRCPRPTRTRRRARRRPQKRSPAAPPPLAAPVRFGARRWPRKPPSNRCR